MRHVGLDSVIRQEAVLGSRDRGVREWIAARIVVHLIAADIGVHGQQSVRVEGMLVAGRDIPRQYPLFLVLGQLVVAVGDLEPVPRREEIQVNDVLACGLPVEPVEDALVVADIVDGQEFGRIQKMARSYSI